MIKYLLYDVEACENLKFSSTSSQLNSEDTMEYIPGTAIRGAYIYKYIQNKKITDINQGEHREKLLNGKIKFLNAYPKFGEYRSIPFPNAYFAPKEQLKSSMGQIPLTLGLDVKLDPGYEKARESEFVGYDEDKYFKLRIPKTSNLHLNKAEKILFRYESIRAGQVFEGIIKVEDDKYLDEIIELFQNTIVYLGGSKGSGYGKCKLKNLRVVESNPEYNNLKGNFQQDIYLIAMSDIIFRNELGEYKTFVDGNYICERLNLNDVKLLDSAIEIKNVTNFNNKWNCHTPNIKAIKAGSVFKYEISGDVDMDLVLEFMDRGIGERKLDGFGRFIIVDGLGEKTLIRKENTETSKENTSTLPKLNRDEESQLKDIINKIYSNRLEADISSKIIALDEKIGNTTCMNRSQWGNLKGLFESLIYENPDEGKEKYDRYIKHIFQKRSESYKQIIKLRYENGRFIDFLNQFVKNSTDIASLNQASHVKHIEIGGLKSDINKNDIYKYNMKTILELFRYQIRKGAEH